MYRGIGINKNYTLSNLDSRKMAVGILKNTSIERADKNSSRNQHPRRQDIQEVSVVDEIVHSKTTPKVFITACLFAGLIIKHVLHSHCYVQL